MDWYGIEVSLQDKSVPSTKYRVQNTKDYRLKTKDYFSISE